MIKKDRMHWLWFKNGKDLKGRLHNKFALPLDLNGKVDMVQLTNFRGKVYIPYENISLWLTQDPPGSNGGEAFQETIVENLMPNSQSIASNGWLTFILHDGNKITVFNKEYAVVTSHVIPFNVSGITYHFGRMFLSRDNGEIVETTISFRRYTTFRTSTYPLKSISFNGTDIIGNYATKLLRVTETATIHTMYVDNMYIDAAIATVGVYWLWSSPSAMSIDIFTPGYAPAHHTQVLMDYETAFVDLDYVGATQEILYVTSTGTIGKLLTTMEDHS